MESSGVATTGLSIKRFALKLSFSGWKMPVLIASYSFLGYKLLNFSQYDVLAAQWKQMPVSQAWWLVAVLALLPLNWLLESLKWKMLTSSVQKITVSDAVKAVLSGISTGFFTPNRVGEIIGRVTFLEPENRKAGVTLSILNSLTQNMVMVLCGTPALILFFWATSGKIEINKTLYLIVLTVSLLMLAGILFTLPQWSLRLKNSRISRNLKSYTDCLYGYNRRDLFHIMGVSLFRYLIFCTQFYFMLQFFGIELAPWQAMVAIPTTYLFVTFTPSIAFSEAAVRSSYAVLVIGAFSGSIAGIALAGICIWAINFIFPMLVGSVVLVRKRN